MAYFKNEATSSGLVGLIITQNSEKIAFPQSGVLLLLATPYRSCISLYMKNDNLMLLIAFIISTAYNNKCIFFNLQKCKSKLTKWVVYICLEWTYPELQGKDR